jgi:hypothetical protein
MLKERHPFIQFQFCLDVLNDSQRSSGGKRNLHDGNGVSRLDEVMIGGSHLFMERVRGGERKREGKERRFQEEGEKKSAPTAAVVVYGKSPDRCY